ncbi:MAG: class I SAM-dependent methyltransferase [Candidatus Kryptoniota bacterium]
MSFAKNYHKWILAEFFPCLGSSVAEVGAGIGDFSALILETTISSLTAFEPSQNMYPLLQEALSKDKRATAINNFLGRAKLEQHFDSILYVNVLEHVEDDSSELANAHNALNPKGHLLIFVPALPWLYGEIDRQVGHFRRYMKNDLVELAHSSGCSVVKAQYFDVAGILPWYINFVLLKNPISGGSVPCTTGYSFLRCESWNALFHHRSGRMCCWLPGKTNTAIHPTLQGARLMVGVALHQQEWREL